MCSAPAHVRFTPNSGHVRCKEECPLCAKSGHWEISVDHLVRAREDRLGHGDAKRLCGFLVDYKLIFGRRLRGANRPMTSEAVAIYFLFFGRGEAWFNSSSASCRKHSLNAAAKAV